MAKFQNNAGYVVDLPSLGITANAGDIIDAPDDFTVLGFDLVTSPVSAKTVSAVPTTPDTPAETN